MLQGGPDGAPGPSTAGDGGGDGGAGGGEGARRGREAEAGRAGQETGPGVQGVSPRAGALPLSPGLTPPTAAGTPGLAARSPLLTPGLSLAGVPPDTQPFIIEPKLEADDNDDDDDLATIVQRLTSGGDAIASDPWRSLAVTVSQSDATCDTCGAYFRSRDELERHQVAHGHVNANTTRCGLCDATFGGVASLRMHVQTHHSGYHSNATTATSSTPGTQGNVPPASSHGNTQTTATAASCHGNASATTTTTTASGSHGNIIATTTTTASRNTRSRTRSNTPSNAPSNDPSNAPDDGPDATSYTCEKCPASFPTPDALFSHQIEARHYGTRCVLCRKNFSDPYKLRRHTDTFHGCGEQFECWLCGRSSNRRDRLADHVVKAHGVHPCFRCRVGFGTRLELQQHKAMHFNERAPPPPGGAMAEAEPLKHFPNPFL